MYHAGDRIVSKAAQLIQDETTNLSEGYMSVSRNQADDISGLWQSQRVGRITASRFGEVCERKRIFAALTTRIVYGKRVDTKAMRYGCEHESTARMQYLLNHHHQV